VSCTAAFAFLIAASLLNGRDSHIGTFRLSTPVAYTFRILVIVAVATQSVPNGSSRFIH
jgi:hypothetical protein